MQEATSVERTATGPSNFISALRSGARAAADWPPVQGKRTFYTAPGRQLAAARPNDGTSDSRQADFTAGSGTQTRYERIAGIDATNYYNDWQQREAKLFSFTTAPLENDMEMAGHAVLSLWVASSEPDTRGRRASGPPTSYGDGAAAAWSTASTCVRR